MSKKSGWYTFRWGIVIGMTPLLPLIAAQLLSVIYPYCCGIIKLFYAFPVYIIGRYPIIIVVFIALITIYLIILFATNQTRGIGAVVGILISLLLIPALNQLETIYRAYAIRRDTNEKVALAQKEDWLEHRLHEPSEPVVTLVIDDGTNRCSEHCLASLVQSSQLQYSGYSHLDGSNYPRELILFKKGRRTACSQTDYDGLQWLRRRSAGLNAWLDENEFSNMCTSVEHQTSVFPYIYIELIPGSGRWRTPVEGGHVGERAGTIAIVTEFTNSHPDGRLLGRWEYGYYPNERPTENLRLGERIVYWKNTGPHGTPFTLQDVITELMGPGYVLELDR